MSANSSITKHPDKHLSEAGRGEINAYLKTGKQAQTSAPTSLKGKLKKAYPISVA